MKGLIDLLATWTIIGIAIGVAWALSIEVSWRLLIVIGLTGLLADRKRYYWNHS